MVSPNPPSAGTDGAFGWGLIITIWLIIHENNHDACAFNVLTTVERIGQVYYLILTYKNAGLPFAPHGMIGFKKIPQARVAGFENRNCQIPTFAPSVPALGGVRETILIGA